MKALVLKIALLLMTFVSNIAAQEVKFEWAKVVGHVGEDVAYSTAVDDNGNVYATGYFTGEVDFDPGESEYFLKSIIRPNGTNSNDIFIAKYNSNGDFVWAKCIGSEGNDMGNSIVIDEFNNVIVTGSFSKLVDFNPGIDEFLLRVHGDTAGGVPDVFVCKLDSSGNFLWAKNMGGERLDVGKAITTDGSNNIYVTGLFIADGDFDPGADTFKLISPFAPYTEPDVFISKLDADGNFVWAKRMGGKDKNWGNSIAVDDFQNVYTVGRFDSTADFDPGDGTFELTSNGAEDIFISKLDSNGSFVWVKQIGGPSTDEGNAVVVDYNGNVIITGLIRGEVDCDPGSSVEMHYSAEGSDGMIIKLNSEGEFLWAKTFDGNTNSLGKAITVDAMGNIYSTGAFSGKIDFDPGEDEYNLQTATKGEGGVIIVGDYNAYISKLDYNGNFQWAKQIGSFDRNSNTHGNSIQIVKSGEVYTAGWSSYFNDFDPGEDTLLFQGYGMRDIFLHKMSQTPFFAAPTQLTVEGRDDGYVQLQWQDNSVNEEGFIIERNISNGGWIVIGSTTANISQFIDSSVTIGNDIHAMYRVYAFEGVEKSGYSNSGGIDIALSIAEYWNHLVSASPNPTFDKITIENPFKNSQKLRIEIYTLSGNLLKEFSLMSQPKLHISLRDQPQGTYLVKLTSGGESFMAKINVMK